MSVLALTIAVDTKQFEDRMKTILAEGPEAIANAVTSTARAGKRAFIREVRADAIGAKFGDKSSGNSAISKAVRPIVKAMPGRPTALMVIPPPGGRYGVKPLVKQAIAGNQNKAGTVTIGTFLETGGASANLELPHGFVIKANGGEVVLVREKSAKGLGRSGGSRKLGGMVTRKIYAETVSAAMKQEDAKPRLTWEKTVNDQLTANIGKAMQEVFDGHRAPPSTGAEE